MHLISRPSQSPTRDALSSRSFLGLLLTQFLGVFNDNMFRWFAVPLGKEVIDPALALSLGAVCFFLPYPLLATPAGYLADHFSKRSVIVWCKVAEVALMLLGLVAILTGSITFLFVVVGTDGCTKRTLFTVAIRSDRRDRPSRKAGQRERLDGDGDDHFVRPGMRGRQQPLLLQAHPRSVGCLGGRPRCDRLRHGGPARTGGQPDDRSARARRPDAALSPQRDCRHRAQFAAGDRQPRPAPHGLGNRLLLVSGFARQYQHRFVRHHRSEPDAGQGRLAPGDARGRRGARQCSGRLVVGIGRRIGHRSPGCRRHLRERLSALHDGRFGQPGGGRRDAASLQLVVRVAVFPGSFRGSVRYSLGGVPAAPQRSACPRLDSRRQQFHFVYVHAGGGRPLLVDADAVPLERQHDLSGGRFGNGPRRDLCRLPHSAGDRPLRGVDHQQADVSPAGPRARELAADRRSAVGRQPRLVARRGAAALGIDAPHPHVGVIPTMSPVGGSTGWPRCGT